MCEAKLCEKRPELIMAPSGGLKNIVVSATPPPPIVSPVRSKIASQSQQISVASCT